MRDVIGEANEAWCLYIHVNQRRKVLVDSPNVTEKYNLTITLYRDRKLYSNMAQKCHRTGDLYLKIFMDM